PEIIGFLCNWCAYEAADSAGRAQKAYPANLKIIRVMCSGRVDPCFILEAFHQGADGVIVMACRRGECHYKTGNIQAIKRHILLTATLQPMGIETERLRLECISAADKDRFVRVAIEMTETLQKLGPLGDR
ncbi:MAG TPA: hydrogenase iron-sulfur subunit, partial [Desulfatirhabdiaceae bacterium]|nr:hydrogenase iron-sulfur subunit [Desulfatirhabdiaceae bacterium]